MTDIITSNTYTFPSNVTYNGIKVTKANLVNKINIPNGVTVYISHQPTFDVNKSEQLTDYVELLINKDTFAPAVDLYLHTFGTVADDFIIIDFTTVNNGEAYFYNKRLQTIALEETVKTALLNMSKEISPYDVDNATRSKLSSTAVAWTTVLNKTITADKVIIKQMQSTDNHSSLIDFIIDGVQYQMCYLPQRGQNVFEFDKIKGSNLQIRLYSSSTSNTILCEMLEINKKA